MNQWPFPKNNLVGDIVSAIESGRISPEDMERIVYAMQGPYIDRYPEISLWMDVTPEDYADTMVKARKNAEKEELYSDGIPDET